jgi:hypothetical protein
MRIEREIMNILSKSEILLLYAPKNVKISPKW